ncbi:MAG: NUDIX domain-containing protein [Geothermobacteraceae bacterium]
MEFKKRQIKTSVVACILDEEKRVLLTRRCIEPFCSQWVMPGGKIDHGEAILAALHREVAEEVGLTVGVDGLIDVFEHIEVGDRDDHYVILYYRCHPLGGDLKPNDRECTEAAWFGPESLPGMDLPPGCRHILSLVYPELDWGQALEVVDPAGEIPDQMSLG